MNWDVSFVKNDGFNIEWRELHKFDLIEIHVMKFLKDKKHLENEDFTYRVIYYVILEGASDILTDIPFPENVFRASKDNCIYVSNHLEGMMETVQLIKQEVEKIKIPV